MEAASSPLGRQESDEDVASTRIFGHAHAIRDLNLKKCGMILADNSSNWFISGGPDSRRNDDDLNTLKKVMGRDFEVVEMERVVGATSAR